MNAPNLFEAEFERQRQRKAASSRHFRGLFAISRLTVVFAVAGLAATAVLGSTFNTISYLDNISAGFSTIPARALASKHFGHEGTSLAISETDKLGQVLGASTSTPEVSTSMLASPSEPASDPSSTISQLINQAFKDLITSGQLTGPQGPAGRDGTTTVVTTDTNLSPLTYYPFDSGQNAGGSVLGVSQLSGSSLSAGQTVIGTSLVDNGTATFNGAANLNGSTTIADLTVTGLNPQFIQGSVVFQGPSGLAQDNSNLFYNSTTHELGLGTTTPSSMLTVAGTSQFTATSTFLGNVGIGNSSPLAVLDVDSNHDFQFLPSNTYGTSTMAGTGPAISTKYGGLYMGLADNDPSYGIDVNPVTPGSNGTRILSYSLAGFCFTAAYPAINCPVEVGNGGNLTVGAAFQGDFVPQNNGLLVQNRVGIGTITPLSTLFVQGTTTYPTLPLFALASSSGTQFLTVTAAGNVGIGTTSDGVPPVVRS